MRRGGGIVKNMLINEKVTLKKKDKGTKIKQIMETTGNIELQIKSIFHLNL